MSRVTISMKAARQFLDAWSHPTAPWQRELDALIAELRRAMEPKRKPRKPLGLFAGVRKMPGSVLVAPLPSKAQKRVHRASIREAVFKRSEVDGVPRCEGPLFFNREDPDRCGNRPTQLAHAFGRGKGRRPECLENCMALCDVCAYQETNNIPDAGFWWNFRAEFFERNGYTAEARAARDRLAFVDARSMLGAGLKRVAQKSESM